jgi:hypothetical protein
LDGVWDPTLMMKDSIRTRMKHIIAINGSSDFVLHRKYRMIKKLPGHGVTVCFCWHFTLRCHWQSATRGGEQLI